MGEGSNKRVYLAIIIISAIMMFVVGNLPFKVKPFGDITFHQESKNMALFLKGHISEDKVVVTKAPGPIIFYTPAYLLAPYDATDDELWVYGVVLTSILMAVSLILIYRTASAFFSRQVGILSVMLFIIFPMHCYYSLGIIGEAPAFFSLAVALFGWSKVYFNAKDFNGWTYVTVGFLCLILNRPNVMLMFGIVFLVILYSWFFRREFFRIYTKPLIISFTIVAIAGLGILQMAKWITNKDGSETQDNLLYYVAHQGRFQFREEPTDFRFWDNEIRPDSKDYQNWKLSAGVLSRKMEANNKTYNEVYREFLISDAIENPWLFTRQFFVKCFYGNIYFINSVNPEQFKLGPLKGRIGYTILILTINLINIIIIFGIFVFLFKQKDHLKYWPFWGIIIALLIFHGLTYMEPRYLFPAKAALYILAAAGLYKLSPIKNTVNKIHSFLYKT